MFWNGFLFFDQASFIFVDLSKNDFAMATESEDPNQKERAVAERDPA